MNDWQRIREAIDACRPDSRDLESDELQDVAEAVRTNSRARQMYERTQRRDAAIRRSFQDVPVPSGLEHRLLARLALATGVEQAVSEQTSEPANDAAVAVAPDGQTPPESNSSDRFSRRKWWLAALSTVAAGALITAVIVFTRPTPLTLAKLSMLAQQWAQQAAENSEDWQPMSDELSRSLRWPAQGWKPLDTDIDKNAVVFNFSSRHGRLYLIRVQTEQEISLPNVPYQPLSSSGQWRLGAWQEQGAIYIAVSDEARLLDSFKARYTAT